MANRQAGFAKSGLGIGDCTALDNLSKNGGMKAPIEQRLKDHRVRLRLSQGKMADFVGEPLTLDKISKIETGRAKPSVEVLQAYSRALKVPLDVLADDSATLPVSLEPGQSNLPTTPAERLQKLLNFWTALSETGQEDLLLMIDAWARIIGRS